MDSSVLKAQNLFHQVVSSVDEKCLPVFLKWVRNHADQLLDDIAPSNEDVILDAIREDLRKALPVNAIMDTETITFPTTGQNADCDPSSTVHVDAFLYDEDCVDELCDEGKLRQNYCCDCGSLNTAPTTFLSHSISSNQLSYLYKFLLPDLRSKTLVDVGSRLGAVLYGAYLYSAATAICGIEMNKHLCTLQQSIVDKYKFVDRVQIIEADVCTQGDILKSADVIVLHNVFEFFMPVEAQQSIWQFLYDTITTSGTLLVVAPSLESSLADIKVNFDVSSWVSLIDVSERVKKGNLYMFGSEDHEDSDLDNLYLYEVKSRL